MGSPTSVILRDGLGGQRLPFVRLLRRDDDPLPEGPAAARRVEQVRAIDGSTVAVNAQSVCLHGDGAHALAFARRIRDRLTAEGIAIRPR